MRIPNRRDRRGFTIIEISVVFSVMLLLALLVVPSFLGSKTNINVEGAKTALRSVASNQESYFNRFGTFAATLQTLAEVEDSYPLILTDAVLGSISVATAFMPGVDGAGSVEYLGLAMLTPEGACITLKISDPASAVEDGTTIFTPQNGGDTCSGATALNQDGAMW